MTRDELLIALTTGTRGRTPDGVACIIVKAGYALVPVEPSFDMIDDSICPDGDELIIYEDYSAQEAHDDIRMRYKAMLKAVEA